MKRNSIAVSYGFAWVTIGFFVFSLCLHWIFGWFAYADEQESLHQPVVFSEFLIEILRDTFENWQSEFLQLLWQVAGLAMLLYVGSPQSKEGDDRMEAKLDAILRHVAPEKADKIISQIDDKYTGRHTDPHYQINKNLSF